MKTCNTCKRTLAVHHFCKNNAKNDRLNIYCRTCVSERNRTFANSRPPRYVKIDRTVKMTSTYRREYYLTNKLRIQEHIENWQSNNKEKIKKYQEKYYQANRELINARRRERNAAKTLSATR